MKTASVIVPAILPSSRKDLDEKLAKARGVAPAVQIDAIDGRFASPASWPYNDGTEFADMAKREDMLPGWGELGFEIDLMTADPERAAAGWVELGVSRVTVHAESTQALGQALAGLQRRFGHSKEFETDLFAIGLAIGLDTDPALIEPFLDRVDYVQIMGIKRIGRQREPFDQRAIERVKRFHRAHPNMPVQVDGGVTKTTAPALLAAGASRLIVGHDLFDAPDFAAEYRALADLATQYGTYE
jgi:ribulose-phosphate 3-epimerase